jgi:hypothetical protein
MKSYVDSVGYKVEPQDIQDMRPCSIDDFSQNDYTKD